MPNQPATPPPPSLPASRKGTDAWQLPFCDYLLITTSSASRNNRKMLLSLFYVADNHPDYFTGDFIISASSTITEFEMHL